MDLIEDWMIGFSARNWWIPWQVLSFVMVILENSCLRLGRRNEEKTRAHCLSERVSSPTAAITLSMISCGISSDFAMDDSEKQQKLHVSRSHDPSSTGLCNNFSKQIATLRLFEAHWSRRMIEYGPPHLRSWLWEAAWVLVFGHSALQKIQCSKHPAFSSFMWNLLVCYRN